MDTIMREEIRVTGRVQAVGFRFRAKQAAMENGVTGFVMNQYDGSVLMEVQGTADSINAMLVKLYGGPFIQIDALERKKLPVKAKEKSFKALYY